MTGSVFSKAVQSLVASLVVKSRVEKKNSPEAFANEIRKYDVMYTFNDLAESTEEYEEMASAGEGVKYVLVIDPKISWANAPELPEEEEEPKAEDNEEKDGAEEEDE